MRGLSQDTDQRTNERTNIKTNINVTDVFRFLYGGTYVQYAVLHTYLIAAILLGVFLHNTEAAKEVTAVV